MHFKWDSSCFCKALLKTCSDTGCSVGRFTGQLTPSDPLQTLFQMHSGRIPAAATVKYPEPNKTLIWRQAYAIACILLLRFNSDFLCSVLWKWKMGRLEAPSGCYAHQWDRRSSHPTEGHRHHGRYTRYWYTDWLTGCHAHTYKLMCVAFPCAASRGLIHAAHVCYLTASVPFGVFTQKAERLALLGSSHRWAVIQTCCHSSVQVLFIWLYWQHELNFLLKHVHVLFWS